MKRKEVEYNQILRELKRIEKSVEAQMEDIKKWRDAEFKKEAINDQLEDITQPPKFPTPFRPRRYRPF